MAGEPAWQELLRLRLVERNAKESAYSHIIEQYRRLAQQTKLLKERNASLLRAVGTVRANPSTSTVNVPGTAEEHPVRAAYISSLEAQVSSLRDELAAVYKTQGQNAQRLLAMNETLREKEEISRVETENLRKAYDELAAARKKMEFHNEVLGEKDRTAEILHDEINTLQLELGQIEERNQQLTKDNAKLLQRWLDTKQTEVNRMNEANEFYEEMRTQKQTVVNWRENSTAPAAGVAALADAMEDATVRVMSVHRNGVDGLDGLVVPALVTPPESGNGERLEGAKGAEMTAGTRSPMRKDVNLTPNG